MEQVSVESAANYGNMLLQMVVSGLIAGIVASAIQILTNFLRERKEKLLHSEAGLPDEKALKLDAIRELRIQAARLNPDCSLAAFKSLLRMSAPWIAGLPGYGELEKKLGRKNTPVSEMAEALNALLAEAEVNTQ